MRGPKVGKKNITVSLDGIWLLNAVGASMSKEAAALPSDIPISIPGDIAQALFDSGHLSDPYYGRNELDALWVGRTDWSLTTSFALDNESAQRAVASAILNFDVIDTVAEITLNGESIDLSQNMFRRLTLDLPGKLNTGENKLEVLIRSPEAYTDEAAEKLPYPIPHTNQFPWQWNNRNLLRKVACHGGWDWGITLMTGGIYETPLLTLGRSGRVESLTTRQEKLPGGNQWALTVSCEYFSRVAQEVTLEYSLGNESSSNTFGVQEGSNILTHLIKVENPELWWPAGQGQQQLYELTVKSPEETQTKNIGFRTAEVIVEDDDVGRSMSFRINGRDIFAKGANWIPVDAFPSRQTPEVYRRLLGDAVEANMNTIRLWGGGQYEKDVFYDICDELGIMIWHDMMFSCSLYPSDEKFLAEVDGEIRYQVKRLKDHPSIVLWCGNNEDLGALTWFPESRENRDRYVVDYDRLNEGVIGRAVRELDPDCTWWPSSPSAGYGDYSDCWHDDTKGDMHYWSVWHEGLPFESYYDVTPRFCSEFGFQSFPGMKTVAGYAPEDQWNPTSPVMRHHQKNNAGNTIILSTMARYFRMSSDFADFLYLSQVQQAWAIRTAVEYWRSQRPVSMGALYWQLNDLWPVASWASIEYDGTWKLLHYEAKRFFAPLWLSIYMKDGNLHVVGLNDNPLVAGGNLVVSLLGFDGSEIDSWDLGDLECPAGSAASFLSKPLAELERDGARKYPAGQKPHDTDEADVVDEGFTDRFVSVEWRVAGSESPVVNSLFLTKPRDCELGDAAITVSRGSRAGTIRLETDVPAFYVALESELAGRFEDAGFTLLPGSPRELSFFPAVDDELPSDFVSGVKVRHLRGTY